MPAKRSNSARTAAEIDAVLPKTFFVMRGHVQAAFGLTSEEMTCLVASGTFRAEYPFGRTRPGRRPGKTIAARARFVRSQVMQLARKMEAAS